MHRLYFLLVLCLTADLYAGPRWVAVGYGGRRISSEDGVTWENDQRWSDESKDDDNVLFSVAYGLGRFIAVGGGAKLGRMLSTADGQEWSELEQKKGRVATVAFGRNRFVAAHGSALLFSTDGKSFEVGGKLPWEGSSHPHRSACGDTEAGFRFVIIGEIDVPQDGRVSWRAATEDGISYAHTALNTPRALDVSYGSGHFVVVGPGGLIESSHDAQTWQRHDVNGADEFSRVVWTGTRFLVSGGKHVWTSPDGLRWKPEPRTIPGNIAWAREPRIPAAPLALSFSWAGIIHTTSDLVTWKEAAIPTGPSFKAIALRGD